MKRVVALLLLITIAACGGHNPPKPPSGPNPDPDNPSNPAALPKHFLAVWVRGETTVLPGADVRVKPILHGAPATFPTTNADGWSGASVSQGRYEVTAEFMGQVASSTVDVIKHTDVELKIGRVPPSLTGKVRTQGRDFITDAGRFRPVFVSNFGCLTQIREGREADCVKYLDWAWQTGFNGVRIFAGALHR